MSVEKIYKDIVKEARSMPSAAESLRFLFSLEKELYRFMGKESVRYGGGLHTKHKHIKYHDFFIENIQDCDIVLDVGCGNGAVDIDILRGRNYINILGIDLNETNINAAKKAYKESGFSVSSTDIFKCEVGNIFDYHFEPDQFDVCILSNTLEHLEERVPLLKKLKQIHPRCILLRVPMYCRSWKIPLMEELGIDYRLDNTHFIEYTESQFEEEIDEAGYKIDNFQVRWGEFWSVVSEKEE